MAKKGTVTYFIVCTYTPKEGDPPRSAIAVCKDPDTPIMFLNPDGTYYAKETLCNYTLYHHLPWSKMEFLPWTDGGVLAKGKVK